MGPASCGPAVCPAVLPCERIIAPDGRQVAELRELLVDRAGRIQYGLIACRARDGRGEKLVPVPWAAFERREAGPGTRLCLQLLSDVLTHLRGYDPRYWPALRTVI